MFSRVKKGEPVAVKSEKKEKPTPAYLREDYPFKAIGEAITDLNTLIPNEVYEIKCRKCEMSIRLQGQNLPAMYKRLMDGNGCIGCGNRELEIKKIKMSKAGEVMADLKEKGLME